MPHLLGDPDRVLACTKLLTKPSADILVEGSRALRQLLSCVFRTGFSSTISRQLETRDVVLVDAVRSPCERSRAVLIPLPVTFCQSAPNRRCHLIHFIVRKAERTVDLGRVIFCATGMIELNVKGQISLYAQVIKVRLMTSPR